MMSQKWPGQFWIRGTNTKLFILINSPKFDTPFVSCSRLYDMIKPFGSLDSLSQKMINKISTPIQFLATPTQRQEPSTHLHCQESSPKQHNGLPFGVGSKSIGMAAHTLSLFDHNIISLYFQKKELLTTIQEQLKAATQSTIYFC